MSKYCTRCGKENLDENNFCDNCGNAINFINLENANYNNQINNSCQVPNYNNSINDYNTNNQQIVNTEMISRDNNKYAGLSVLFGIIGFIALAFGWFIGIIQAVGFYYASKGSRSEKATLAKIGMILNVASIVIFVILKIAIG